MSIKRIERKSFLGPIRINTSSSGASSVGEQVVRFADSQRERHYKVAVAAAEKSGKLLAAEADLTSITNIDQDTGKSEIINQAINLGTFQKEAFEGAVFLRFKNAVEDKIASKASQLTAKYENENNAPELFTEEFTSFLDGLGQDSKGFYKQYIVDRGGNYLEAKRTDLEVARTRRIYEEMAEEKEKGIETKQKVFFNLGTRLDHASFAKELNTSLNNLQVYKSIGVTDEKEIEEARKKFRKSAISGALAKLLEDPDIAMNASAILQYYESMGSKHYYNTLSPAAKDAVKQIKNLYGNFFNAEDFLEVANDNNAVFQNAINIGKTYTEIETAKAENLKNIYESIQTQTKDAIKLGIDKTTTNIMDFIASDEYRTLGTAGSITQIQERIKYLNDLPTLLNSSDERDLTKHRKLKTEIENAKDQIAEGLVVRMMRTSDGRQNAEQIANIFESGDFEQLVDYMPSLQFNLFNQVAQSDNKKAFQDIATGTKDNVKLEFNKTEAAKEIQAVNEANYLKRLAASNTSNHVEIDLLAKSLENKYKNSSNKIKKLIGEAVNNVQGPINNKLEAAQKLEFSTQSEQIAFNSDLSNYLANIDYVQKVGKDLNIEKEAISVAIQEIFDQAVSDRFSIAFTSKPTEQKIDFLTALKGFVNPAGKTISSQLDPAIRKEINSLLNETYKIDGKIYKVNEKKVFDQVNQALTTAKEVLAVDNKNKRKSILHSNLQNGTYNPSSHTDANGRAELINHIEEITGSAINPRIYTLSLQEIQQMPATQRDSILQQYKLLKDSGSLTDHFIDTYNQFDRGILNETEIAEFLRNTRELAMTDASGSLNMGRAVYDLLGKDNASKLKAYYQIYNFFPAQNRNAEILKVIRSANETPMTNEEFRTITGSKGPYELIDNISTIPDEIIQEFVPAAELLAPIYGKTLETVLTNMIDARFMTHPNMYSPITASSLVPNDFGTDKKQNLNPLFYAVEQKVNEINQAMPDAQYFFDPETDITVEDFMSGQAILPIQILDDLIGDNETDLAARISAGQKRVVFGPTLQSSAQRPEGQLYAIVSATGAIQPIPNTVFTLQDEWVKNAFAEYAEIVAAEKKKNPPVMMYYLGKDPTVPQLVETDLTRKDIFR